MKLKTYAYDIEFRRLRLQVILTTCLILRPKFALCLCVLVHSLEKTMTEKVTKKPQCDQIIVYMDNRGFSQEVVSVRKTFIPA